MDTVQVPCLVLLKSPHPPKTAIYLMIEDTFSQDQVEDEKKNPGSSIMDYTYNEKVILTDYYFGSRVKEISFAGMKDNNDAFQFAGFITKVEADAVIAKLKQDDPDFDVQHSGGYDYKDFMHELFPDCYQEWT